MTTPRIIGNEDYREERAARAEPPQELLEGHGAPAGEDRPAVLAALAGEPDRETELQEHVARLPWRTRRPLAMITTLSTICSTSASPWLETRTAAPWSCD